MSGLFTVHYHDGKKRRVKDINAISKTHAKEEWKKNALETDTYLRVKKKA